MKLNFSQTLGLNLQTIGQTKQVEVKLPVHHIVCTDVSGSMYGTLPEVRRHLKNKLSTLVGEQDTISLVWFSGKGQFGVLQEGVAIRSLTDMKPLHNAIDRFLQPVGLTGFKEPLVEVGKLVDRLKTINSNALTNLIFMTDGHDNQWSTTEIIAAVEELSNKVDSTTIVEYGWGCNRTLLSKMADTIGGNLVFAEHFDSYQNTFESSITREVMGGKKSLVKLETPAVLGYAFSTDASGNMVSYSVNANNEILVSESVTEIAYFTTGGAVDVGNRTIPGVTYAGLATLSQRMLANEIFVTLGYLGDVYFANRFINAFSKQDYTDFQNECVSAVTDSKLQFREGYSANVVPKEDAYTVLDLLADLTEDPSNLVYPLDPDFGYKRIGKKTEVKNDTPGVKFGYSEENPGVSFRNVVFNADRPNASVNVRFDGSVDLSGIENATKLGLPSKIKSFIYRNYTIIKDGIVHTRNLPVSLTTQTAAKLAAAGLVVEAGKKFNLDISKLPVINRKMVKSVSAKETFTKVFQLEVLKAEQKTLKHFRDETSEKKSEGFAKVFGDDAAAWLKEVGVTDYNGFNPPSKDIAGVDVYSAVELNITVEKLSSLPKVEDVVAKMKAGKSLTLRESIMKPSIDKVMDFLTSDVFMAASNPDVVKKAWLDSEADIAIQRVRKLNMEMSKVKFAVVVGHVWFSDMTPDQNSMTLNVDGYDITVNANLVDKEITI